MARSRSIRSQPRRGRRRGSRRCLHLRRAGKTDLDLLVRHRRRMWEELRDFSPRQLDRADTVYRRWVRREMARGKFEAMIVEDVGGLPVGSGALWLMPCQPRPGPLGRMEMPYILSMFTEPEQRGRGVASRIVREMVRWARIRRYGRIVLHASRFGEPVYAQIGFRASREMRLDLIPQPAAR